MQKNTNIPTNTTCSPLPTALATCKQITKLYKLTGLVKISVRHKFADIPICSMLKYAITDIPIWNMSRMLITGTNLHLSR